MFLLVEALAISLDSAISPAQAVYSVCIIVHSICVQIQLNQVQGEAFIFIDDNYIIIYI